MVYYGEAGGLEQLEREILIDRHGVRVISFVKEKGLDAESKSALKIHL